MGRNQRKKKRQAEQRRGSTESASNSCPSCQAAVSDSARFCEACGGRLVGLESPDSLPADETPIADATHHAAEFDATEGQRLARQMLSAHLELIATTTKEARSLERGVEKSADGLSRLTREAPNPSRTSRLESLVEGLEGIGDDWEDLQRSHNDKLEALDEDFLDRFAEIDLDVELPPKSQEKFDSHMNELLTLLDTLQEQIAELGAGAMRELSRSGMRFGSLPATPRFLLFFSLLLVGLGGSLAWLMGQGQDVGGALLSLAPVTIFSSVALSLSLRRR